MSMLHAELRLSDMANRGGLYAPSPLWYVIVLIGFAAFEYLQQSDSSGRFISVTKHRNTC